MSSTTTTATAAAPLPHELRGEPRWSHYEEQLPLLPWTRATDEQLVALVTRSTASGERFPVGVNWLEVSRTVAHSPVECVKRYALLHDSSSTLAQPSAPPGTSTTDNLHAVPFSELSSSDDGIGSPQRRPTFSGFSTPLTSPKLSSLDTSDEFGLASPGSPPPFAVRTVRPTIGSDATATVSSPQRWDALLLSDVESAPVLRSPPHARRGSTLGPTSSGATSPRIVHGTQDHTRAMRDPQFAPSIISHAFKGMAIVDTTPPVTSPRMIRTTSGHGDFPFLKDDDVKRLHTRSQTDASAPAFLASPRSGAVPPTTLVNEQQLQAHLLQMSAMSAASSFHGDNPFAGSLTQSALEDAFLDMAGSRLDASNVLLTSRFSMAQSRASALERSSLRPRTANSHSNSSTTEPHALSS